MEEEHWVYSSSVERCPDSTEAKGSTPFKPTKHCLISLMVEQLFRNQSVIVRFCYEAPYKNTLA